MVCGTWGACVCVCVCVCVCGVFCVRTEALCLVPVVDDIFPPTLSPLAHPFPRILWSLAFLGAACDFPWEGLCVFWLNYSLYISSPTLPLLVAPLHPSSTWLLKHFFLAFYFLLSLLHPDPSETVYVLVSQPYIFHPQTLFQGPQ